MAWLITLGRENGRNEIRDDEDRVQFRGDVEDAMKLLARVLERSAQINGKLEADLVIVRDLLRGDSLPTQSEQLSVIEADLESIVLEPYPERT